MGILQPDEGGRRGSQHFSDRIDDRKRRGAVGHLVFVTVVHEVHNNAGLWLRGTRHCL